MEQYYSQLIVGLELLVGFTGASCLNMVFPAGSASVTCITLDVESVLALFG